MSAATLAFLHHAAAFLLVAIVLVELVLIRDGLTPGSARTLVRMDALYGLSALVLLIVGFLRVFYTEKGPEYYFHSLPFLIKLGSFLAVGLLSIYPTVEFLRWRKALQASQVPVVGASTLARLKRLIHLELVLLFVIMLCAALMARGIGFIG
jgi:putative membrane protein